MTERRHNYLFKNLKMSKYLYLIDPGHGGIINGNYVTSGKRSPVFPDNSVLYEGVNNRDNTVKLLLALHKEGIRAIDIVNSNEDISLEERVKRANHLHKDTPCVYISIHSDAAGNGAEWHEASGISVYTSPGQTKSDVLASLVIDNLEEQFTNTVKWRKDSSDGDEDKEAHFYVLEKTACPSILIEAGFHTNKLEAQRMLTDEWKNKLINAIVNAIKQFEKL